MLKKRKSESGAAMVESVACILILCMVFFSLLQIWQWAMAKMLCEYSSFYGAKGRALGYSRSIVRRASRVAATGCSGEDISGAPATAPFGRYDLGLRAQDYMQYSQYGLYQVNYEFWEPENTDSTTPYLNVSYRNNSLDQFVGTRVQVDNMPLLYRYEDASSPGISGMVQGATNADIPYGESVMYNHSLHYLEDEDY